MFFLGFNDLAVLRSVIRGYVAYARRTTPSSHVQLQLLEGIYHRLTGIPPGALEAHIMLLAPEMYALDSALLGFAACVRHMVPPSQERDETLQDLERFRQHLACLHSTFQK
jgi:hypothetical protein